ncbi:MAG: internal scaffolding protein [Microvirus sp.]|nr:MAG: internal scaffolding protein [Microvirus sp.]
MSFHRRDSEGNIISPRRVCIDKFVPAEVLDTSKATADMCDINRIVERHRLIDPSLATLYEAAEGSQGKFGVDLSAIPNYSQTMDRIAGIKSIYSSMPRSIRDTFDVDGFVTYFSDPANFAFAKKAGLFEGVDFKPLQAAVAAGGGHSSPLDVTVPTDTKSGVQGDLFNNKEVKGEKS